MNLKLFIYGALFFLCAHIVTWFQLNGQFLWKFFKEGITLKTFVSLLLSFSLICIQVFWKN